MENPPPIRRQTLPKAISSWPKIMGIIGLIVAILGILSALSNIAYMLIMKVIGFDRYFELMIAGMESDPNFQGDEDFKNMFASMGDLMDSMLLPIIAMGVMVLALSILLLLACIKLIKRARKARAMMIIWSYAAIAVGLVSTLLSNRMNSKMMNEMFANLDAGPGPDMSGITTMISAFSVIGAIAVMIVPIFILIWFNRSRIKDEISGDTWI